MTEAEQRARELSKSRHPSSRKDPKVSEAREETWYDLVHKVAQEFCEYGVWLLEPDEMDELLWEHTAFPVGNRETIERQLREEFENMAEKQWSTRQEGR